ncbi:MAG: nucleotide exchange factor GrpE [Candidatus Puniceispirillum sp.]|nr:nucleotide exchange factor GrpE [Candidatus Puniceispirillum sp.]MBL6774744.1 nucleotide exchange factor GrpE [Candidatus Puniceispirillum sp.]
MTDPKNGTEVADGDKTAGSGNDVPASNNADNTANGTTSDEAQDDLIAAAGAQSDTAAQSDEHVDSEDPLLALTAERDQLKDQLLRALADAENMRRRSEREAANVRKYGHTPFARDLVGAIDNLARVIDSAPDDLGQSDQTIKSLITGIQLSWTELQSVIEKHGIKRVEPLNEKFDYNLHQAMFEVPTNDQPSGIVLEVVQHGYVLHDRLLRPAMVGVSKAGDAAAPGDGEPQKTDK